MVQPAQWRRLYRQSERGVLWVLAPGDNIEAFVDFHVKNIGIYLNDQELLYAMARESYGAAQKLADWGVKAPAKVGKIENWRFQIWYPKGGLSMDPMGGGL